MEHWEIIRLPLGRGLQKVGTAGGIHFEEQKIVH